VRSRRGDPSSRTARAVATWLLLLLALAPVGAGAARIPGVGPDGTATVPPFGVGETLVFELKYGFIAAGDAVMMIQELATERGRLCYHIVSVAESKPFFSVFFRVRDVAESYMDVRDLVSLRFEKHIQEGDFRSDDVALFDQDRHVALYPKRDQLVPLSLAAQDILSSLYYVRMMDLEVGGSVSIENHADKKNYPLEIQVLRRERVDVPAGTFDCVVVEPKLKGAGLFRHSGRLWVWLTDDERHLPVLMKSKVIIGSVAAVLTDYRLAPDDGSGKEN